MLKDVIDAGGPGLLIPAILFALVLYVVRGLFGLHGRRSQHRREFIEHWNPERVDDDLWLEVAIRQLYGVYLPAHVIRTALTQPHSSQALIELSELWPFLHYDANRGTVRWRYARHRRSAARRLSRCWPFFRYLICALGALAMAYVATLVEGLSQWVYAALATILGVGAFISLWDENAEKIAHDVGEDWIARINSVSEIEDDTASLDTPLNQQQQMNSLQPSGTKT